MQTTELLIVFVVMSISSNDNITISHKMFHCKKKLQEERQKSNKICCIDTKQTSKIEGIVLKHWAWQAEVQGTSTFWQLCFVEWQILTLQMTWKFILLIFVTLCFSSSTTYKVYTKFKWSCGVFRIIIASFSKPTQNYIFLYYTLCFS